MRQYFVNDEAGRLRAGWRILIFLILFIVVAMGIQTIIKFYAGGIPKSTPILREALVIGIAAVAATISVFLARRFLDKQTFASMGLQINNRTFGDLIFGFFLSGAMAAAVFFIMLANGWIEYSGINWGGTPDAAAASSLAATLSFVGFGSLGFFLVLHTVVSWWEEIVFRGYLLQNMIAGLGLIIAIILSCILYGAVHAMNPNATILSSAIIVLFGFLRIFGFLATKMLWLSMGMHIGWNFFQGPIFGYPASGHETITLVQQSPTGPDWLSGGAFGPEGSVVTIPVIGLAILIMWIWSRRKP
ncbi:MAG: hypothetical protein DHS20C05_18250 [Hyphococcus sp.]|nr:MAG: hypothetical protein DHS20C05_18250 [Marinicaulis sp.]